MNKEKQTSVNFYSVPSVPVLFDLKFTVSTENANILVMLFALFPRLEVLMTSTDVWRPAKIQK